MDDNKNTNTKLSKRQIEVGRRNLVSVCRFAVKSLIDKACFSSVDDGCEEFINFCAVLEQVFLHRIRPHKTWYGGAEGRYFWDYIRAACRHVPQSCIISIDAIENIRSPAAKGRAFIRCALMEKKLSEYVAAALKQTHITRKHYYDGAIMLCEDSNMLCGILLGLNAIDFSFCLKGQNMDLLGPLAIDFTPFLQFHQSVESVVSDLEEMRELSNSSISSSIMSEDVSEDSWRNKYKNLEHKYKSVCEQKGYLEELVRLRERQTEEISREHQNLEMRVQYVEAEAQRDRLQLENVVLELQEQLGRVKSERQMLQQRVSLLMSMNPPPGSHRVTEIQMAEMAGERLMEQQSFGDSTETVSSRHLQNVQQQDNKSLLSGSSGQFSAREDTHSMIPLTGSLTDVQMRSADSPLHQPSRTTETPRIQVKSAETTPKSQSRSESVDRESLPDLEAEYHQRPPSQAFPSFTCVDLDTSLEKDEHLDEAFVAESNDPLSIDNQNESKDGNGNKDMQSELKAGDEAKTETSEDMVNSNTNASDKSDSGNSDFDILAETDKSSSNESSIELAEAPESVKSSSITTLNNSDEDFQQIGSDEPQSDSAPEVIDDSPEKTQSLSKEQKDESNDVEQEHQADQQGGMEQEEEHQEDHEEGKEQEQEQQEGHVKGEQDHQQDQEEENVEEQDEEHQVEEEKVKDTVKSQEEGIEGETKPEGIDSGSSEGEKDWDLLSDSSNNGQTQEPKQDEEKTE